MSHITLDEPEILYVPAYLQTASALEGFEELIEKEHIDILIIETVMGGYLATQGEYPAARFALNAARHMPTFLIPEDTKAVDRRPFFYLLEDRDVIPLDNAYSAMLPEVLSRMKTYWATDNINFTDKIKKEFQMPEEERYHSAE